MGQLLWVLFYTGGPTWVLHQRHICHQFFSRRGRERFPQQRIFYRETGTSSRTAGVGAHPFPLNSPPQQFQPVLNFAFFCRERRDCGGIYLQREQSRTVAANLKLAVGSAFRSVKDRADISNVFGRAELWFHSEHFSWFALSLSAVNGLDAERLQSAAARVRFCSLQPWSSGREKAALQLPFGQIVKKERLSRRNSCVL